MRSVRTIGRIRRIQRTGAFAALVAVLGAGCADEQEPLIVVNSPGWQDFACVANPDSPTTLQRGLVDVGFNTAYTLPISLLNNLASRPGTTTNTGIEDGELQLRDVDVSLSMPQATEVIRQVAAANSANVEFAAVLATDSLLPGAQNGVLVDVLPQATAAAFRDAILSNPNLGADAQPILAATLVFHATRTGNSAGSVGVIDAREYTFPIEICIGCIGRDCSGCEEESDCQAPYAGICGNAQDGPVWPTICDPPTG
ncbi:MAG: hypothetical protein AAGF11_18220 [Myxococcota bacterium]